MSPGNWLHTLESGASLQEGSPVRPSSDGGVRDGYAADYVCEEFAEREITTEKRLETVGKALEANREAQLALQSWLAVLKKRCVHTLHPSRRKRAGWPAASG